MVPLQDKDLVGHKLAEGTLVEDTPVEDIPVEDVPDDILEGVVRTPVEGY